MKKISMISFLTLSVFMAPLAIKAETKTTATVSTTDQKTKPTDTPRGFITEIYKLREQEKGPLLQDDTYPLEKYFAESTAALLRKDRKLAEAEGGVGALEADVFYNSQDPEIKNFTIVKSHNEKKRVYLQVAFENAGKKETIDFKLVYENGGWKIEDIRYSDGSALVKKLKTYRQ